MYSVTGRARSYKQPYGGFLRPSEFETTTIDDGFSVVGDENVHAAVVGMAVDYLTRYMMGDRIEEAFAISILGYRNRINELGKDLEIKDKQNRIDIGSLLDEITGTDDISIISACKAVTYDVWYRYGNPGNNVKGPLETNPNEATINNIRIMVNRCIVFWKMNGPIVSAGFTFDPSGYTDIVSAGDGDYLTEDTLWDLKVLKAKPTSKHTLQILMYLLMGLHSGKREFKLITRIGIYNPRLNMAFVIPISSISEETIKTVEKDVIGYKKSIISHRAKPAYSLKSRRRNRTERFAKIVLWTCIMLIMAILFLCLRPNKRPNPADTEVFNTETINNANGDLKSHANSAVRIDYHRSESLQEQAAEINSTNAQYVRIRNGKNINVRKSPSTSALKIGMAKAGERYRLLGVADNGWFEIELEEGRIGYISNRLASIDDQ